MLEDLLGELDNPMMALNVLLELTEQHAEEDWNIYGNMTRLDAKKVMAMLFAMRLVIKHTFGLHKKYERMLKIQEE
ncbi:hypothetical protein IJ579_07770 [bacterium]|nr:hypothetical protein [bacterium]